MDAKKIWENYPFLYHMAAKGSWESIKEHGLFSTTSLLDLFQITGNARNAIENQHRPELVSIENNDYGEAIIRDQKPMSDLGLNRALRDSLTPRDWYKILNTKTFFWLTYDRLLRLLGARAYKNNAHDVLVLHTRPLVENNIGKITLSPMNTGCTMPFPHKRGIKTFRSINDYPFEERRRKAGINNAIVELAVEGCVENVSKYVKKVVEMKGSKILRNIYIP